MGLVGSGVLRSMVISGIRHVVVGDSTGVEDDELWLEAGKAWQEEQESGVRGQNRESFASASPVSGYACGTEKVGKWKYWCHGGVPGFEIGDGREVVLFGSHGTARAVFQIWRLTSMSASDGQRGLFARKEDILASW